VDDEFRAYLAGRADGIAGRRDDKRTGDDETGRDYRTGFLDGRLEVFRLLTHVRRIVEESDD
jgi:hypothetical protein